MTAAAELIAGVRALVLGVSDTAADPADRIRLLTALATAAPPVDGDPTLAAVGRRAALAALARATSECRPRSYDDAVALRDAVCGLLAGEERVASDAGEDGVARALRSLRGIVGRDLDRRGASLSPLRDVTLKASVPSLVLAHRLYGDAGRAGELAEMAGDPPRPTFMPRGFRALAG